MSNHANVTVYVKEGESLAKALRLFNKKCERLGVIKDIKKNRYYIKPSDAKKLRKKIAIRAQKRLVEQEKVNY